MQPGDNRNNRVAQSSIDFFFPPSVSHECPFNICRLLEPVKGCCGINALVLICHCYIYKLGKLTNKLSIHAAP